MVRMFYFPPPAPFGGASFFTKACIVVRITACMQNNILHACVLLGVKLTVMVFLSWQQLRETGNTWSEQVGRGARKFACQLWEKYPRQFVPNNPISSALKYFWNTICDADGIQVVSPAIFNGGQCYKDYYISCKFRNSNTQSGACNALITATTTSKTPGYINGKLLDVGFFFVEAVNNTILAAKVERRAAKFKTVTK